MRVLFGSQTGCAREVAEHIARLLGRRNFAPVHVEEMDRYVATTLPRKGFVVFVASTTGDGDPPDNMKVFWRSMLLKSLPSDLLQGLHFAVFGLGDSSYVNFNVVARKLRNRLVRLGAQEVAVRGLGDDQSEFGLEGDLDAWLDLEFWPKVLAKYPLPEGFVVDDTPQLFKPRIDVREICFEDRGSLPSEMVRLHTNPRAGSYVDQDGNPTIVGTLVENRRITAVDWEQDVRHVEIELPKGKCPPYAAGDIALVYPENVLESEKLESFASRVGLSRRLDATVSCEKFKVLGLPGKLSVRDLLGKYLDVLGTPRRHFFELVHFFANEPEEKEKLLELSTREGNDLFHAYCQKERKTYVDVFEDFKSVTLPLEFALEMIPLMQPRQYSIASCRAAHGDRIHLTVAILEFLTPWARKKCGVASKWFRTLPVGSSISLSIKSGTLRCPESDDAPMVLIGPGTGIAPMRSIVYERKIRGSRNQYVYFGCRSSTKDFYYEEEWAKLLDEKSVQAVRTAFSRDQPRKIYVQTRLKEDSELLWKLLVEENGYCYISGSATRMPTEVRESIIESLASHRVRLSKSDGSGEVSAEDAKAEAVRLVKRMDLQGRLRVESWS